MMDAITHFYRIYNSLSPIMILFALRFSTSHPNILPPADFPSELLEGLPIERFTKLDRTQFFLKLFPRICAALDKASNPKSRGERRGQS